MLNVANKYCLCDIDARKMYNIKLSSYVPRISHRGSFVIDIMECIGVEIGDWNTNIRIGRLY